MRLIAMVLGLAALVLSGCQTGSTSSGTPEASVSLSAEELAALEVTFETTSFEPPERSTEAVLKRLTYQDVRHHSGCKARPFYEPPDQNRKLPRSEGRKGIEFRANAIRQYANRALQYGDFGRSIDYAESATSALPFRWVGHRGTFDLFTSILYSMVGFHDDALSYYRRGAAAFGQPHMFGSSPARSRQAYERFLPVMNAARGFLLHAQGDLESAELLLRAGAQAMPHDFNGLNRSIIGYFHVLSLLDLKRFDEAEAIARRMALDRNDPIYAMWAYDSLALVFMHQGRHEAAELVARKAQFFFEKRCAPLHYFVVARANLRLAQSLAALGRWEEALALFEKIEEAHTVDETGVTENLLFGSPDLGVALIAAGQSGKAVVKLEAIVAKTKQLYAAGSLPALEAVAFLALARLEAQGTDEILRAELRAALDGYAQEFSAADGADTGSAARNRRTDFLVARYLSHVASSGSVAEKATAVRFAQLGQGGGVQAALAASAVRSEIDDPLLRDIVRKQQAAANRARDIGRLILARSAMSAASGEATRVDDLIAERNRLDAASRQLYQQIQEKFPEFGALLSNRPVGAEEVQKVLRPGETVVFVRTTEISTYVWAFSSSGQGMMHEAPLGERRIGRMVTKIRESLDPATIRTIGDVPDFDVLGANRLYQALLEPANAILEPAESLIIVANGALRQLPFSLLVRNMPDGRLKAANDEDGLLFSRYRELEWLADSHAVSILPTLNALNILRRGAAGSAPRPLIAFGDPFFSKAQAENAARNGDDGTAGRRGVGDLAMRSLPGTRALNSASLKDLPRLPETRAEVIAIGETLRADPTRDLILGARATEDAVKAAPLDQYRTVAFATHGLVAGDLDGLFEPALALTTPDLDGGEGDGLLTMSEILNLRLNADWVVLSACNTAAADGAGAEAVAGLGRAFFYAGARSLLVSNWPVHSKATEVLTTTAFSAIQTHGVSRSEAMRRARAALIRSEAHRDRTGRALFSYAHPIFWAPFVVVGDSV